MNSAILEKSTFRAPRIISPPMLPVKASWGPRVLLTASAALTILALTLTRLHAPLERAVEHRKREYQLDLDLSRHKTERLHTYQSLMDRVKIPQARTLDPNEWIQRIQGMVASEQISLKELKAVYHRKTSGKQTASLLLELEGHVQNLFQFFYRLAESNDYVYVSEFSISNLSEGSDSIRAELTLSQMETLV